LGEKIGRDRFYVLLNRTLLFAFAVFLVLCGIAILGQVLGYMTAAKAASLDELKGEMELRHADAETKQRAIAEYQRALDLSRDDKLSEAIASVEASLKAVPTVTARETLALLYQKAGNRQGAIRLAEEAVSGAHASGDAVKIAKAERLLADIKTPAQPIAVQACPPGAALVGAKLKLPLGGDEFETATVLVPCVYSGQFDVTASQPTYYKVALKGGQTLRVVLRTRGVEPAGASIKLYGPDGGSIKGYSMHGENAIGPPLEYKADQSGAAYIKLSGGVRGAALDISVQ
jgi:hypothetical protein